jgi:alcohol dehydrogenase class IV
LPDQLKKLELKKPLVVTDKGLLSTESFKTLTELAGNSWPVFADVHPNPLLEDVEKGAADYRQHGCDSVIGFGGGSALDAAKAIRLLVKDPKAKLAEFNWQDDWRGLAKFIAIPTTAGTGSEVGRSSVLIIGGIKKVLFNPALLADLVLLDPEVTRALPPKLTAATGADALTHCIESFTSPNFHPLCDAIALEGAHLVKKYLSRAVKSGNDLEARGRMLVAAMMGGIAFQKDLGATHSLAHPLSSICGLHHGLANALCLPAVMEFNAEKMPGLYRRVGTAMDLSDLSDFAVIGAVRKLFEDVGISGGLKAHGVEEKHLDPLADQAIQDGCHQTNPVPVTREDLRNLFQKSL